MTTKKIAGLKGDSFGELIVVEIKNPFVPMIGIGKRIQILYQGSEVVFYDIPLLIHITDRRSLSKISPKID
jgi:hypothetical protein